MSIYPLDRTKRYKTPGGGLVKASSITLWEIASSVYTFTEDDLQSLFGESLTEVVEMTEVTVEFDAKALHSGSMFLGISSDRNLPRLKPNTLAHFTVTMRYPKGSELTEETKS